MKRVPMLACGVLLAINTFAAERIISIKDQSAAGSPVESSGTVVFSGSESKAGMSHAANWIITNKSKKSIVAVVETLTIDYPNGQSFAVKAQYECFFGPEVLSPDGNVDFSSDSGEVVTQNPSVPVKELTAEIVTRWVQFEDGTTFGDVSYAQQLLTNRAVILHDLQGLEKAYDDGGPQIFLEELGASRNQAAEVDGYIGHIRQVAQRQGAEKAVEVLRMHLRTANLRIPLKLDSEPQSGIPAK